MADHWRSPVMRFLTMTQSPAAYTSGRLVRSRSSTRMVPLNISMPVSASQAVLGRTPTLSTTRSAGRVPAATPPMISTFMVILLFSPARLSAGHAVRRRGDLNFIIADLSPLNRGKPCKNAQKARGPEGPAPGRQCRWSARKYISQNRAAKEGSRPPA